MQDKLEVVVSISSPRVAVWKAGLRLMTAACFIMVLFDACCFCVVTGVTATCAGDMRERRPALIDSVLVQPTVFTCSNSHSYSPCLLDVCDGIAFHSSSESCSSGDLVQLDEVFVEFLARQTSVSPVFLRWLDQVSLSPLLELGLGSFFDAQRKLEDGLQFAKMHGLHLRRRPRRLAEGLLEPPHARQHSAGVFA